MRALLQRVAEAAVTVDGAEIGRIGAGLCVLLGVEKGDTDAVADRLAERTVELRVFPDDAGRMNRSLIEMGGSLLVVSQFTLVADTRRGRRPGFEPAAPPEVAAPLCERFVAAARRRSVTVATGRFGADMQVHIVNDGPVTFLLDLRAEP
jgi:D-tyrosyl-tRNA(Tyr) deacylase